MCANKTYLQKTFALNRLPKKLNFARIGELVSEYLRSIQQFFVQYTCPVSLGKRDRDYEELAFDC